MGVVKIVVGGGRLGKMVKWLGKMALGGGMQDKNEVGAGRSYPCVPPLRILWLHPVV